MTEALTYRREGPYSYFRDLAFLELGVGGIEARGRLEKHRREVAGVYEKRQQLAERRFAESGMEYRVEPNRTDGQGGYFAPPLWINELFATANRPGRVLADLIRRHFPLPAGVSSINLPRITAGTTVATPIDTAAVPSTAVTDAAGSSTVVMFAGDSNWAVQDLELSPVGAALDEAIFTDLTEAYDAELETQLLNGTGVSFDQLVGVANVSGIISVTYSSGSPSGSAMWPYFGQTFAQIADGSTIGTGRNLPPECWLMRSARWAWLMGQEDTASRPFGIAGVGFLGSTDDTPNPVGGLYGIPVFTDDAIAYNLPAPGGTQDQAIGLRPSDMVFFEGTPRTAVIREPGSGTLSVKFQLRNYAAAITNRRPAGIGVLGGSGFALQSGY